MKLASYEIDNRHSYGIITNDEKVIDLGSKLPSRTLLELLQSNSLRDAQRLSNGEPDCSVADITFQLPIIGGEKIICVGINYPEREEEYKGQIPRGDYPNLFVRFPSSFSAHGQAIIRPKASQQLDYEGEIAIVIGKEGRYISKNNALSHVGAITAANEGTIRDWVKHGSRNVTQGKNFVHSGGLGPYIVTTDEINMANPLRVTTKVNGQVRQDNTSNNMFWQFDELINYISTFTKLVPGDIILTGTPVGAGAHQTPPKYLVPGDKVEVEVEGIVTLSNNIEDEL